MDPEITSFRDQRLVWHNGEPPHWKISADNKLTIAPGAGPDYWSRTFYGPALLLKSDAPSLVADLSQGQEASLTTAFTLHPRAQFDQAGIMVIVEDVDENGARSTNAWVKAGIEYTDGHPNLSCVVTNAGFSDWSTQRITFDNVGDNNYTSSESTTAKENQKVSIRVRLTKHLPGLEQGPCITMEACECRAGDTAETPGAWRQIRIASLRESSSNSRWRMGVFSISPVAQENSHVEFHHIRLGPKIKPVHGANLQAGGHGEVDS